jgi:hypothetical protein
MEYGVEWYQIYRNGDEMSQLTGGIPRAKNYLIDEIEQGLIKFLEIQH